MEKKMGPVLLSGFMIGPILGSGIILLPPMVYGKIGGSAIYGWMIMMVLGAIFAMIFARLTVLHPGEGGMTIAVDQVFGTRGKLLSAYALIAAVLFGPVPVLYTAAEYLVMLPILGGVSPIPVTLALVLVGLLILMNDVRVVSKIILVVSSIITVILLISSVYVLGSKGLVAEPVSSVGGLAFGRALMLLFWAIIGWEIVGNYSEAVRDRKRTIMTATVVSVAVISVTYILVALAIQTLPGKSPSLVGVLAPLFGEASVQLLAVLVTGLCFSTYLTIVGAVGRLVHSLAAEGYLPALFSVKRGRTPVRPIALYSVIHVTVLVLMRLGVMDLETLVAIANGFFIGNAMIGLAASVKILDTLPYRAGALALLLSFTGLLAFMEAGTFVGYSVILLAVVVTTKKTGQLVVDSTSISDKACRESGQI